MWALSSKYTGLDGIIYISTYAFLLNFEVLSMKSGTLKTPPHHEDGLT
jgi:hypothetical protein